VVTSGSTVFVLVVVYQLGSHAVTEDFISNLSDVLERTSSATRCVLVGYVDVSLDDATSADGIKLLSLLGAFNMYDCVHQPTHHRGHQLDVVVVRRDQPVTSIRVDTPVMSDHSLITGTLDVANTNSAPTTTRHVMCRRWRTFDIFAFTNDLRQSPRRRLTSATYLTATMGRHGRCPTSTPYRAAQQSVATRQHRGSMTNVANVKRKQGRWRQHTK
jgi:hypothetical protein